VPKSLDQINFTKFEIIHGYANENGVVNILEDLLIYDENENLVFYGMIIE
jgi:hypothetical protein